MTTLTATDEGVMPPLARGALVVGLIYVFRAGMFIVVPLVGVALLR